MTQKNEDQPLVLHTLPLVKEPEPVLDETAPPKTPGKNGSSSATIPRLVSVAEIIKREYLKRLQAQKSPLLHGVHQYNEIGCLEDLDASLIQPIDPMLALSGSKKCVLFVATTALTYFQSSVCKSEKAST